MCQDQVSLGYFEQWKLRYVFYHEKFEVIEQRMKERAENLWVDDHTLYLDIQTLSYNAHQAPCHCVYGVYFSVLFVGWQILSI